MERLEQVRILVVYCTRGGTLRALAEEIAAGARGVGGVEVDLCELSEQPVGELRPGETEAAMLARRAGILNRIAASDALVVGAPAYFGSMASSLKRFLEDCATAPSPLRPDRSRPWRTFLFRDKVGAAFTASATPHGGNEQALHSMLTALMHLGLLVVTPGLREPVLEDPSAPYGATAVTGVGEPHGLAEAEREEARRLGQRVAERAAWVAIGRLEWHRRRDTEEREAYMAAHTEPVRPD
jgi:NAD(P)H dehydrogenase (quinone)